MEDWLGLPTSVLISGDVRVVKRVDGLVSYDEIDKAIQSQFEANERSAHSVGFSLSPDALKIVV